MEKRNQLFSNLRKLNLKKATNLGELSLVPKIHKDLC